MRLSGARLTFLVVIVVLTLPIEALNCSECCLVANDSFRDDISLLNSADKQVVWITLKLDGNETERLENEFSGVFKPNLWAVLLKSQGRNHLQMAAWQQIRYVNLLNLRLGDADISTSVRSEPLACFYEKTADDKLLLIRKFLFHHFQVPTISYEGTENASEICNGVVVGSDYNKRTAVLAYNCCKKNKTGDINCAIMETGIWIEVLSYYYWVVSFVAILVTIIQVMNTKKKDRPVTSDTKYHLLEDAQRYRQNEQEFNSNSNNYQVKACLNLTHENTPNALTLKIGRDQIRDNKIRQINLDYLLLYIITKCLCCKPDCVLLLYRKIKWILFILLTCSICFVRFCIVDPSLTSHFQALANAAEKINMTDKYYWNQVNIGMNIGAMITASINFIFWVVDIVFLRCNPKKMLRSTKNFSRKRLNFPSDAFPTFFQNFENVKLINVMTGLHFLTVLFMTFYICTHFVGTAFFTFVEILANAGITLQWITLLLIFLMHCYRACLELKTTYKSFHKDIEAKLLEVCKENKSTEEGMYKVFLVVTPSGQQSTDEETMRYHGILVYPKRELTGVKQEKQPEEDVSLHVVTLPFFKCPGSIASNIVRAAKKLIVTAAVLFFIFLVVKAYGDASELSMINQLLALIIVAFFPFWSGCFFAVPNTDHLQQNKCISRIYRRPQKCNLIFQKINRATNPQDHESILTETRNSSSLQTANNLSEYDFLSSIVMGAFEVR